ncbi:MAG TPA: GGDEF domain-containing protein [Polyangia bacterium]|nr:GGDEF domain-containing protein [Polyangia bacterium]
MAIVRPLTQLDLPGGWRAARPFVEALGLCIEAGLLILDAAGNVLFCNPGMASMLDLEGDAIERLTAAELTELIRTRVPEPPPVVRDRALIPPAGGIVCEEFEMRGSSRTVVRWVAQAVERPEPATVVVCTDITADVDLARMHEEDATTDRLTETLNRRGIEPHLTREMSLAARHRVPLSAVLLDIDHFKSVNDVHGHNVGDAVLRAVGEVIRKTARATDLVSRWGGEEFLVLLPHTDLQRAHLAAERIRVAVESARPLEARPITISAGVAEFVPGDSARSLVQRADKQLYAAKAGGRNRTC